MKKNNRSRFIRPVGIREYHHIYNLFMEGQKTEHLYFNILKQQCIHARIILHPSTTRTQPNQILARVKNYLSKNPLGNNEEAWIIVDVDNRAADKFKRLLEWKDQNIKHGIALSCPRFEYWLLLHFESGDGIKNIEDQLKRYLPHFKKNKLDIKKFEHEQFQNAITNAKKKHGSCFDPFIDYHSTAYLLLEKILINSI